MQRRTDVIKTFIVDFNFVVFDERPGIRPLSLAYDYADVDAREVFDYQLSLGNNAIFCHAVTINGCAMYPSRLGPVSAGRAGTLATDLYAMARARGLPFVVVNDGEVTALAGSLATGGAADCRTSGEISTDFSLQVERNRFEEPGKHALAVIGKGGPELSLASKRGNIHLLWLPRHFKREEAEKPAEGAPSK
mgnify:CR=1 FL=1